MIRDEFDNKINEELYEEGCSLLQINKLEEAKQKFNEIIEMDPNAFHAINKLGVIYGKNQDFATAVKCFAKALSIKPGYAPALVNLGNIENENGQLEAAANYYKQAIDSNKDYYNAYYNLAVLYKRSGDYKAYMDNMKQYKKCLRGNVISDEKHNIKKLYSKISAKHICILSGIVLLVIWSLFK